MQQEKKVKLLIVTQKVDMNDGVLGFFHGWISEFARRASSVTVICLFKGNYKLPDNVKVLSLGKEDRQSRITYTARFFQYIVRERNNYDVVFVHMNPIYVVLGGVVWRMLGKNIGLWYTHKSVTALLRLAERLADVIFTASQESFRLPSRKLRVMGHGIDTARFAGLAATRAASSMFRILTIGRISPVKDYETLIEAVKVVHDKGMQLSVTVVGGVVDEQHENYFRMLKDLVTQKGLESLVTFTGEVPNAQIEVYLRNADTFVNMSQTGSLDKAALEAMAAKIPTLTSNEAIAAILGEQHKNLIFVSKNSDSLAQVLKSIARLSVEERNAIGESLQAIVKKDHDIGLLIPNIVKELERAQ